MTNFLTLLKHFRMILFHGVSYCMMVVMRAGFEVCNRYIVLFCSTYMTSIAAPASLVLIPEHTAGCKASGIYS